MKIDTGRILKVSPPLKSDIRIIRTLIVCGLLSMCLFVAWFINPSHLGYAPIFWPLTFALLFKLLKMAHEWYHYWSPSVPIIPPVSKKWTVDILTTACPGEPKEMIIRTLKAIQAVRHPHTSYLCDEGDDPELKKVCDELGVKHITRVLKKDAKAGNINNALKQATGEICVVLDPDHVPVPEFLDRVLPYFEDKKVGFVQCVQGYMNQEESFVARGAAEQTYHFYGPMMMCMNTYGTVQAIGANCTFRREALNSIGGHAAGLSEDMHTAMQLHAKGWKSVYVPEMLTRGLVPATLSSFYKQQLKWSRGTFELLFRTLPGLFSKFTWRQKLHYLTLPMYFLFGLINLIDIAIPLLALSLAEVPWEINLGQFALYFFPVCAFSLIIRMFAQVWLLEKSERGFHIAGGILRLATWWIFLIGFVFTIFKIRVPYIPTPKEDEHQNYVTLSVPNLIIIIFSFALIYYGLSLDWSPYSLLMASYSLTTSLMLAFTVMVSQQKLIRSVDRFIGKIPVFASATRVAVNYVRLGTGGAYTLFRNGPVMVIIALSMLFLSYSITGGEAVSGNAAGQKELGGFYAGITYPYKQNTLKLSLPISVISVSQDWGCCTEPFMTGVFNEIKKQAGIPLVHWQTINSASDQRRLYADIRCGKYNQYLRACAGFFRKYDHPVFISFGEKNGKSPSVGARDFILTWQYLYTFFNDLGISNLSWVWCPATVEDENFYPGEKFTDWIGISCLNYASSPNKKDWYSFSEIYQPFRKRLGKFRKPVMITEFGSAAGAEQQRWISTALKDIGAQFLEVRSLVIFIESKKTVWTANGDSACYVTDFSPDENSLKVLTDRLSELKPLNMEVRPQMKALVYHSKFISGKPGNFQLMVNHQPFYIQGVAYNTAHDWRDGNMPLTRRQVEKDFQKIREMGANTIRRYGSGIYDRNVLNIASEFDLKVLYGFWFDPKIDFYSDRKRVEDYLEDVEEKVREYKDHPAVLAWSVGNESWGLLKHHFAKPYLTLVRKAYIEMIEEMARRIHAIDSTRPVFTCVEHESYQLPGELCALRDFAPSFDGIGINSYYGQQISRLNHIAWQFDSLRPYIVSEFGPSGYWDPMYNKTHDNVVLEETDAEKAAWYTKQWAAYVKGYGGYNIGGFAYCWHDRMEGSYTWFGLTDFKGRQKPSYYALRELWKNIHPPTIPSFSIAAPGSFISGNIYRYTALGNQGSKDLLFEWHLHKDEYLKEIDNIEVSENPASVNVAIPEEPSNYRLYLYVSDKNQGWVTTASVPIRVKEQVK